VGKDRPFIKFYTSCFLAETAGMDDQQVGRHVRDSLLAWSFGDKTKMPQWMLLAKSEADKKSETYRKNKQTSIDNNCEPLISVDNNCEPLISVDNNCEPLPISSLLFSSDVFISSLEKSTERNKSSSWNSRFHEFLTAGPPCWLNFEAQAFLEWKNMPYSDPTVTEDDIIASAMAFRGAKERDKTESRYITRPNNFLASGAYKTDWSNIGIPTENRNTNLTDEEMDAY